MGEGRGHCGAAGAQLAQYSESFKQLTVEGARARMPPLQAPLMSTGDVEPATVVANLRAGMEQLSQMAAERASLEERMRETRNSENVLSKLLSGMSPSEELFEQVQACHPAAWASQPPYPPFASPCCLAQRGAASGEDSMGRMARKVVGMGAYAPKQRLRSQVPC